MRRRKIMIICNDIEKVRDEYLEWYGVLDEYLGHKLKGDLEDRRIETPTAIMDFVKESPLCVRGYQYILDLVQDLETEEQNERLLRILLGEEILEKE